MGKIELDHTGSGGGVTLSSDGTDLLLDGTAIGGGGAALELYAENPSSPTAPSATGTNAVAIGSESVSAGLRSIAVGKSRAGGDDSFAAAIGNSTSSYGVKDVADRAVSIGSFSDARAVEAVAIGREASAQGLKSASLGYRSFSIGVQSVAAGQSYAGGSNSFAAAIVNNTSSYGATASNSVAIGYQAKANVAYGTAIGYGNIAGSYATAIGGTYNSATGQASFATGENTSAVQRGKIAFGASQSGVLQQGGILVLRKFTSDATPTALYAGGSTVGANQVILPNNSAYAFHGTIVAREQASAGTDCAAWKVEGLIRREGSAGTTVLVNSATTVLDNTPSWGLALSADTTNGGLKVEATGAAATNIRWVATIHTSEVTYA